MKACRFVAEVSSNHNRDLARALAFVDEAARLRCAAVKFQQFRVESLFAPEALAADPRLLLRKGWETPPDFNRALATRAHERGILFASTPFDRRAIEELAPWVDLFKVSSYQVLWLDFLREVAATGKPVSLATGMATQEEVCAAVQALREGGCSDLTLLHCVSSYPARPEECNLAAIETLRRSFDAAIGWSDHSVSAAVLTRAVQRFGAEMIEFHLDLDRQGAEFGIGHCWLPAEIRSAMRACAAARPCAQHSLLDGNGVKRPQPSELEERPWRSDPADGLRPLLWMRASLRAARSA